MQTVTFPRLARLAAACLLAVALPAIGAAPDAEQIEREWRDLLAAGPDPTIYPTYSVASRMEDERGEVVEARCREGAEALAKAAADAPLAAYVQYVAYRCADLTGDDAAAERHLERFGAVARHALAQAHEDRESAPIRVLAGRDIYAILNASGLELRYEQLEPFPQQRHLIVHVAAWDKDAKVERHLRFDYLDSLITLSGTPEDSRFPAQRLETRRNLARELADSEMVMGLDWLATLAARDAATPQLRVASLREAADLGGVLSTDLWLMVCAQEPHDDCGEGLVDSLLPRAEEGDGWPLVQLAVAHAAGIGVARDEAAAMTLLDRADARVPGGGAIVKYTRLMNDVGVKEYSPALVQRLEAAATAGNPEALILILLGEWRGSAEGARPVLAPARLEALTRHARNGSVAATNLLAEYHLADGRDAEAAPLVAHAAELGSPSAQAMLARKLAEDGADPAVVARWRELAAAGGDPESMLMLGWMQQRDGNRADAMEWYRSAAMAGSDAGALGYAQLLLDSDPGAGATARAVQILGRIETADARRALAWMYLAGKRVPKDPERAIELLEVDAKQGDRLSQTVLGIGWLEGEFGRVDAAAGQRWLRDGLAEHDPAVVNGYGMHLAYAEGVADGRAQALALFRAAIAGKPHADLYNNAAWLLCTSPGLDAADRSEGMAIARRMGDADTAGAMGLGPLDTVAACHAAVGEYPRAAALQQRVVDGLARMDAESVSLVAMRERLESYLAGRIWLETPEFLAAEAAREAAAEAAADAAGVAPQAGEDALNYRNPNKGRQ